MKISKLPIADALSDEDLFPVVQNGETKSAKKKDLFKNIPEPKNNGDAVNKQYVDNLKKQVEENIKKLKAR